MEHIDILTTQNVSIHRKIAGIGDRLLAHIIDLLVIGATMLVINLIIIGGSIQGMVYFLILFIYPLLCDLLFGGKTFGKMALNIRVVRLDGTSPGTFDFLIRWILIIPDYFLTMGGLAYLWMIIGGKGQRLGDYAAGTITIKQKKKISLESTGFVQLSEDYKPTFEEVKHLENSDIVTIKEVLDYVNSKDEGDTHSIVILYKTKKKITEKAFINSDMKPLEFLNLIISDYNYYSSRI